MVYNLANEKFPSAINTHQLKTKHPIGDTVRHTTGRNVTNKEVIWTMSTQETSALVVGQLAGFDSQQISLYYKYSQLVEGG